MSEKTKKFGEQLDALITRGDSLRMAIQHDCHPKEFEKQVSEAFKGDEDKIEKYLKDLPDFRSSYQAWYSEAQAVIKQVMPDRLADFISYFEYPRVRKDITFQNYMIRDYLQGLKITRAGYEVVADGSAAIPEFVQQLNLVKAAKATLDSALMDLKAVLQADLFDSEIETAGALAKAGYLRAAGAICGVVLEKHLHHVCDTHNIKVTKKNPSISDLIQLLKDGGTITVAQWRFIQSLADTRNLCDHAKGREPTKEEIADLLAGTEKTMKQVF
ncbi:hypothetical protein [Frigidibacter oleivorans]|uniref:hypothetical protein n=1 Tax=Frigidibacter oleivorans TaxID=2487129 RepID=UPI001F172969|nr:hypothetical protein [Frigidibacter oleivorans]